MRLLVVEDEHKLARVIKKALESEGYAVDVEHDSSGGFAMASTEPYGAILVDRMLPGDYQDGVEMVKRLRADKIFTPTLILTALGDISHKTEGLDAGADDYLVKPFAIDELLARVRALLRRPPNQTPTILTCGKLSFNTTTRTVTFEDKSISLTAKECGLLEFLLSAEGRAVSKGQIIAHVWDFDADVLPNTVEVYVRSLRKKIDARFNVRYIKTVHGVGYKMEA